MGDWRGESGGGDGGVISDVDAWECVGVRKGVREGRWGTRYTKQYSCAESWPREGIWPSGLGSFVFY
jgi:hypothetical protein